MRLTDRERQTLVNLLTVEIQASRFPLSDRIARLKAIRAKLASAGAAPSPPARPRAARRNRRIRP